MWDRLYKKMSSIKNLELAWMRINTGQNIYYKNYYRNLLFSYEMSEQENLKRLSERLIGGSFEPSDVLKFYLPKKSGLHRPITFLHLDDLIVYQAFANIIFDKFEKQRKKVENNNVYSYVLNRNKKKNIFMFKKWQECYRNFINKIKKYYNNGNIWVAHFDLAAYYDTIDHQLFIKQISPRNAYTNFTNFIDDCLKKWSSHKTKKLGHSIPQGPLSSSLIGELYLLPIDKKLNKKKIKYIRYVDDIKIFGKSREEVLRGIILLERECKERGLIPQTRKYEILKAENIDEAIGKFPSLRREDKKVLFSNKEECFQIFINAFNHTEFDISKVKYILKSSGKNKKILNIVLGNLKTHPELIDEFCVFLENYLEIKQVGVKIYNIGLENPSPYEYVEGKLWGLLSEFNLDDSVRQTYINKAILRLKNNWSNYSLKLGIYKFLCSTRNTLIFKWLQNESSSLIQSMVIPYIYNDCILKEEYLSLMKIFFKRTNYEPALVAIKDIISVSNDNLLKKLVPPKNDKSGVIKNILGKSEKIDSIGQILKKSYNINYYNKWNVFLGNGYDHANKIIFLADKAFYIDKNSWINYIDSFNDIIVRKLINLLSEVKSDIKWPKTITKNGKNSDYGNLLEKNNQFCKNFSKISNNFRKIHKRRSQTPTSHPYDKKTLKETNIITGKEQKQFQNKLEIVYQQFVDELIELI